MITYKNFIEEFRRLTDDARALRDAPQMHQDERFRKWRNELDGTINLVVQARYLLPCPIKVQHRTFGFIPRPSTPEERLALYQMERDDTINELEFIIQSYEKHGEPPKARAKTEKGLEWPHKITLSWLFQHMPLHMWVTLLAAFLVAFVLGTQIGRSGLYDRFVEVITKNREPNRRGVTVEEVNESRTGI